MFVLLIVMLAHVLGSHQFCSHSNLHIIQLDVYGTENMQSHPASHTYNPLPIDHPPTPTEIHCIALRVWSMLCPNSISILLCRPVLTLMWCFSAFICGKSQQTNERSKQKKRVNDTKEVIKDSLSPMRPSMVCVSIALWRAWTGVTRFCCFCPSAFCPCLRTDLYPAFSEHA